jgi:hypothetical protein
MFVRSALSVSFALAVSAQFAFGSQLLLNPGFETPVVDSSDTCNGSPAFCLAFNAGDNIGGWTVVQGPGSAATLGIVDILGANYTENGGSLRFDPAEGTQSLDLTGNDNQGPNGVQQTVATLAGASYTLGFDVGNQDNSLGNYGLFSSVDLYVDGALVSGSPYTTTVSTAGDIAWQNFMYTFTADDSGLTTVTFINNTPLADNFTGLDDVTLEGPSPVPEPASWAMAGAGLVFLCSMRPSLV